MISSPIYIHSKLKTEKKYIANFKIESKRLKEMQETTIKSCSCLTRMIASGQKLRHKQKQIKKGNEAYYSLICKGKVETSASGDGVCAERVLKLEEC